MAPEITSVYALMPASSDRPCCAREAAMLRMAVTTASSWRTFWVCATMSASRSTITGVRTAMTSVQAPVLRQAQRVLSAIGYDWHRRETPSVRPDLRAAALSYRAKLKARIGIVRFSRVGHDPEDPFVARISV